MSQSIDVDATSPAVQAHLGIIQNIIQRMSANSASSKAFCVTLVSAILVVVADKGKPQYALLALLPVLVFGLLDAYYLSLEKGFRNSYDSFVSKLCRKQIYDIDLFCASPSGDKIKLQIQALISFSVWAFYIPLALLVFLAKNIAIG